MWVTWYVGLIFILDAARCFKLTEPALSREYANGLNNRLNNSGMLYAHLFFVRIR